MKTEDEIRNKLSAKYYGENFNWLCGDRKRIIKDFANTIFQKQLENGKR